MNRRESLLLLLAMPLVGVLQSATLGQARIDFIPGGYATSVSADGSVVVGNTIGDYETFRWTRSTGLERLGRGTFGTLGVGAGAPDVSADGTRISATILGSTNTYVTQGRWTEGQGWTEMMPPLPLDGGLIDSAYGSAWGLSGDGETLVGLYWRPGHAATGLAHASAWTEATNVVDLGSSGGNSRANDANYDGSVVVGWDEDTSFGYWRPAVWVDGQRSLLADTEAFTMAIAVNPDGSTIVGQSVDTSTSTAVAARWDWNGNTWEEQLLGFLPGTVIGHGSVQANDLTADGETIVGFNRFAFNPNSTGFVWTEADGMISADDFLAMHGIQIPNFQVTTFSGISEDGMTIVGSGVDLVAPFEERGFVLTIPEPSSWLLLAMILPLCGWCRHRSNLLTE